MLTKVITPRVQKDMEWSGSGALNKLFDLDVTELVSSEISKIEIVYEQIDFIWMSVSWNECFLETQEESC